MRLQRDVIVVGGSTGGLDALMRIASTWPASLAATVLVVLHSGEDSPRLLASHVGRKTALHVTYAEHGDTPRPGCIYIAPPGRHLEVAMPGVLQLVDGPKVRHVRPAVDRLFETAAAVYGRRVIGVVLTGGDGDGTAGLRAIKAAGGLSVVQSPADSVEPSMPTHALLHDSPDHVVLVDELGPLLLSLVGVQAVLKT